MESKIVQLKLVSELLSAASAIVQGQNLMGGHRGNLDDSIRITNNDIYYEIQRLEKEAKGPEYTHLKTGDIYNVPMLNIINATNSANDELMNLYVNKEGKPFVRESVEFDEKFELIDSNIEEDLPFDKMCRFLWRMVKVRNENETLYFKELIESENDEKLFRIRNEASDLIMSVNVSCYINPNRNMPIYTFSNFKVPVDEHLIIFVKSKLLTEYLLPMMRDVLSFGCELNIGSDILADLTSVGANINLINHPEVDKWTDYRINPLAEGRVWIHK